MSAPTRLRHRVGQVIQERALWAPGDRVAVAVSGGLDSMVLLDLLVATTRWHQGVLSVVTVDHGTRPGSASDAAFVAMQAKLRDLPCHTVTLSLGQGASQQSCRTARYQAFEALPVRAVALAHHRDDQAETVLLALLRGSGTRGLGAMGWRRGRYVRPLLEEPKAALAAWANHHNLPWRDDPSNQHTTYLRNALRHHVVPELERLRPGAAKALARSAQWAAADEAYLQRLVPPQPTDGLHWDCAWVATGPEPLVRRWLQRLFPKATANHISALVSACARGSGRVMLPDGQVVIIEGGRAETRKHS